MLLTLLLVLAAIGTVLGYGRVQWKSGTRELRTKLAAGRRLGAITRYDPRELAPLPPPVQRYFRAVLAEGQAMVVAADFAQTGSLNMSATAEQWRPFMSTQRVVLQRPGFDWEARLRLALGFRMVVHDAYVAGEGRLRVALLGVLTMVNLRDRAELARGELIRFLAEAPWYPTALLPSQGVVWHARDDHSATASLTDGDRTITLLFRFNADGLIETVRAEARGRMIGKNSVTMPWEGRFWNYVVREGMRVPLEAEVAWMTADGPKLYCREELTRLSYEFAL